MITRRTALGAGFALLSATMVGPSAATAATTCRVEGRIRLPSGRRIGYAEYGDPHGPLVFYFHGTPGSRVEAGLLQGEIAASGVRLIALERPGIGLSDYQPGRRILDWPADVVCVAEALGYAGSAFGVVGLSGGAPYALACLKCIPERLTHVAVVSGHTPPGSPVQSGNQDRLIALIIRRPRLGRIGLRFADRRLDRRPDRFIERAAESWAPVDRRLVLRNPSYRATLHRTLQEATRQGTAGLQADVTLLGSPWGFRLCDLPAASVSIWHGGCDPIAPVSMGHYFHRQIAGSELTVDPRAGHITMIKWHAAAILSRLGVTAGTTMAPVATAPL